MVSAVVQTLTEFPTVERVEFLVGGKKRDRLTFGTEISGTFERGQLNLESLNAAADVAAMGAISLYFPGEGGNLIVPVTRMVYGPVSYTHLDVYKRQDSRYAGDDGHSGYHRCGEHGLNEMPGRGRRDSAPGHGGYGAESGIFRPGPRMLPGRAVHRRRVRWPPGQIPYWRVGFGL